MAHEYGIAVETPICRYLPNFDGSDKNTITLRHLMQHSAGIEIAIQSLCAQDADVWLPMIAAAPLHAPPRTRVRYCCTNFWLLARVTEHIAGATLNALFAERIIAPLGLARTTLEPLSLFAPHEVAPTEVEATSGTALHGVVHDEAARAWRQMTGTCAGNAGLFGTAREVARFAQMWLHDGDGVLPPQLVQRALTDLAPEGSNPRHAALLARVELAKGCPSVRAAGFVGARRFHWPHVVDHPANATR